MRKNANRGRLRFILPATSPTDTLTAIFGKVRHEVVEAGDAISALEKRYSRPDLVLSGVVMPGMDGVEMAMLIRQRHPH